MNESWDDHSDEPTEFFNEAYVPVAGADWRDNSATVYLDYRDQEALHARQYQQPDENPLIQERQRLDPLSRGIFSLDEQGQFRLERLLSSGGFSWVYTGRQQTEAFEKQIVLKVLLPRGKDTDFKAEAATLAQLGNHANIIDIYDGRTTQGYDRDGYGYRYQWLAMPYASGGSLEGWAERYREEGLEIPLDSLVTIVEQTASALDYAHHNGRIHRDIKPANILFDQNGQVLLSDFGIAVDVSVSGRALAYSSAGTPPYMSPEQFNGDGQLDGRTDVYSLGVTLYRLLTGELPYPGKDLDSLRYQIAKWPVPSARSISRQVSRDVDKVLQRAMAKSPEDRYTTAGELAQAFRNAVSAPRRRVLITAGIVAILLIIGVIPAVAVASSKSGGAAATAIAATATQGAGAAIQTITAVATVAGVEATAAQVVILTQQAAAEETADVLAMATTTALQTTREFETVAAARTATWEALPRPVAGTHTFLGKEGGSIESADHEGSWACDVGRYRRIDSIEVETDGSLIVNTTEWVTYKWDEARFRSNPCVFTHLSAIGNTAIFLQPVGGAEKIFHDRVSGDAAETYKMETGKTYTSAFHFPAPTPGNQVFDLHVSDEDYVIRELDLGG